MKEINPHILGQLLRTKKMKISKKQLDEFREIIKPEVVTELQESLEMTTFEGKNSPDRCKKFLNNFYLYRGLSKYYEDKKKELKSASEGSGEVLDQEKD